MNCGGIILGVILMMALWTSSNVTDFGAQFVSGVQDPNDFMTKAPVAISGNNIYIAWSTNKTGNWEVWFRASDDSGLTFGERINLSNGSGPDSTRAEIAAEGGQVIVTWWNTDLTSDKPVARLSNDNGNTFGPLLRLTADELIGVE
jgi:hypothetical protein